MFNLIYFDTLTNKCTQ